MYRKVVLSLWLTAIILAIPSFSVRAADTVVETVSDCGDCKPKHGFKAWCYQLFWGKPKDEGYERRKESCIFAVGPAGPYLHPEKYEAPLPPMPPMIHGPFEPMPPGMMPIEP